MSENEVQGHQEKITTWQTWLQEFKNGHMPVDAVPEEVIYLLRLCRYDYPEHGRSARKDLPTTDEFKNAVSFYYRDSVNIMTVLMAHPCELFIPFIVREIGEIYEETNPGVRLGRYASTASGQDVAARIEEVVKVASALVRPEHFPHAIRTYCNSINEPSAGLRKPVVTVLTAMGRDILVPILKLVAGGDIATCIGETASGYNRADYMTDGVAPLLRETIDSMSLRGDALRVLASVLKGDQTIISDISPLEAARALGTLGYIEALPHLVTGLHDSQWLVQGACLDALGGLETPTIDVPIVAFLKEKGALPTKEDKWLVTRAIAAVQSTSKEMLRSMFGQRTTWDKLLKRRPWAEVLNSLGSTEAREIDQMVEHAITHYVKNWPHLTNKRVLWDRLGFLAEDTGVRD